MLISQASIVVVILGEKALYLFILTVLHTKFEATITILKTSLPTQFSACFLRFHEVLEHISQRIGRVVQDAYTWGPYYPKQLCKVVPFLARPAGLTGS